MTDERTAVGALDAGTAGAATEPDLWRRNRRLLLWSIGGYVAVLTVLMIVGGVSITPDVLLIALGLAAVLLGRGRLFARDWVPFIGLFLAYELMRGFADNLGGAVHEADVLALERWLFAGLLPTQLLQDVLHPSSGLDPWAIAGTIFYLLHFPLPLAVAFFLWLRRRRAYYDFIAALILLSMVGFATYLVLPVAPPWLAAEHGLISGPDGQPAITYLKRQGFDDLARIFGFEGRFLFSYAIYEVNPNQVAAFPSLHAAYPFLAFLFARRQFGRPGWLMLPYSAGVWFSIVYLADHYVVDVIGGLAYAGLAYVAVVHAPGWFRRAVDRAADPQIETAVATADATGDDAAIRRLQGRVRWPQVRQGLGLMAVGAVGIVAMAWFDALGGDDQPQFLIPWAMELAGVLRTATALLSRAPEP
ncbi:MAG: phosphatase PAP2 family protein [Chloroflexi bacterium]|nr:phosphatase PAP2 family protein [Chloroflexota bacterium]